MDKHYHRDWAKAKSRDLVREMIERSLLKFRKPQDLRVLCFPGIDAQEILEVYDALHIPRQNIVGIERDKGIAEVLRQKELGIQVVQSSLEDYIERQDRGLHFDIISLDYTGPLVLSQMETLKQIREKQRRKDFVLHCANLIKRDKFGLDMCEYGYAINTKVKTDHNNRPLTLIPEDDFNQVWEKTVHAVTHREDEVTRKEMRAQGYSYAIKGCLYGGTGEVLRRLFKFYSGKEYESMVQTLENVLQRDLNQNIVLDVKDPIGSVIGDVYFPIIQKRIEKFIWDMHIGGCIINNIKDSGLQYILFCAIFDGAKEEQFFREKDAACYSYISESGSPMIGDVFVLRSEENRASIGREMLRFMGYPNEFIIPEGYDRRRFGALFNDYLKATRKNAKPDQIESLEDVERNRIFLGNSYTPRLTKKKAIRELQEGATVDDLREKYRGSEELSLPQIKAHVTMGTYSKEKGVVGKRVVEKPTTEGVDTEGMERITKQDAIDLIKLDVPLEEILAVYPTSFTMGQLRAYKAHMTMGTYK